MGSIMKTISGLTDHAQEQAHHRLGIRGTALARTAAKALESGVRMASTSGRLYRWMYDRLEPGYILRVHAEHLWIFGEDSHALVTVYQLPVELRAAALRAAVRRAGEDY